MKYLINIKDYGQDFLSAGQEKRDIVARMLCYIVCPSSTTNDTLWVEPKEMDMGIFNKEWIATLMAVKDQNFPTMNAEDVEALAALHTIIFWQMQFYGYQDDKYVHTSFSMAMERKYMHLFCNSSKSPPNVPDEIWGPVTNFIKKHYNGVFFEFSADLGDISEVGVVQLFSNAHEDKRDKLFGGIYLILKELYTKIMTRNNRQGYGSGRQ